MRSQGPYEIDDSPDRVDPDAVWQFLSAEAYWSRWRSRDDVQRQIQGAWRIVGCYDGQGHMVGFARARGCSARLWPSRLRRSGPGLPRRRVSPGKSPRMRAWPGAPARNEYLRCLVSRAAPGAASRERTGPRTSRDRSFRTARWHVASRAGIADRIREARSGGTGSARPDREGPDRPGQIRRDRAGQIRRDRAGQIRRDRAGQARSAATGPASQIRRDRTGQPDPEKRRKRRSQGGPGKCDRTEKVTLWP
jgi:hypothetical protein